MPADDEPPALVVLLAGPSGCGKSHVAAASGLPVLALDDFYRDGADPDMPRTPDGVIDWEDPASWDADAAVAALRTLCEGEAVVVPTYSFADDGAVGHHEIRRERSPIVVAEGIFAADAIAPLEAAGLLADALLLRERRVVTFLRRLVRDLREGRKGRLRLLRMGWAKTRAQPAVIARQIALGAHPISKADARARIARLVADRASGAADLRR